MPGVELRKVVKRYGALEVVHGVDIDVAPREFLVLVGPSGCGKSTTLRMIAGLEDISDGELSIDGRLVNDVAPKDRDVAMVFQNYALYPHLNVADNIAFGLRLRKAPKATIASQIDEVAGILGLTEYLDRKPSDLSGGQRQRVAMGRAIVRQPKVFLFDEPLSNLDAKLRTHMRAEIKRLHRRLGVTSIYVTHDQVEAMTLADRIVVMNAGRVEQIGAPMDLFHNPANMFVAGFLGSPPMNMLEAIVDSHEGKPVARIGDGFIPLPALRALQGRAGDRVIVGIRPEFVQPATPDTIAQVPLAVDLIEPLGSEALVHATVADTPFIMKADTQIGIGHLHDIAGFSADPKLVRVFDTQTGNSFNHAEGSHGDR